MILIYERGYRERWKAWYKMDTVVSGRDRRARVLRNVSRARRDMFTLLCHVSSADGIDLRGTPDELVKRVHMIFR